MQLRGEINNKMVINMRKHTKLFPDD